MKKPEFCEKFYTKLNQLISELDIKILACAVKKEAHMEKYGLEAVDPYHLSLNVLVERLCFMVGDNDKKAHIIAEARDAVLDRQLDLAWLNVKVSGTKFIQASEINRKVESLSTKTKEDHLAGLEIADAIVTPIARRILNRKSRIDLNIIKSKMRKNNIGEVTGYGLVVLPK
jgi:hypothetical protein